MPPYEEKYPVGAQVKIAPTERLQAFMRPHYKYHDPLSEEQLSLAGQCDTVRSVGYYFGGDVLYWLSVAPGTWHEDCLDPA